VTAHGWLLDGDPAIRWQALHDREGAVGSPSRWNTLRALRVLDWWDGARDHVQ
jgi:hypothetical protein